ncbi:MAG TPA: ABC-F family ATP-binding cassette domain-containing protein [Chitinophagales bacterium]|nr:ABC-F family ATP-binding cassette domain-containing protein [Chitinophagales bacterium]
MPFFAGSMNILVAENLTKSYGERVLFDNLSFGLTEGDKVALVARNGAGKTSLLQILAGRDNADSGKMSYNGAVTVGYLEQDPAFNNNETILQNIFRQPTPEMKAVAEYELLNALAMTGKDVHKELEESIHKLDALEAWDIEARAKTILGKLGLHHAHLPMNTLSGGQRRRVALARLLIESPQMLLLDEPTNHLDVEMVEWLEEYLSRQQITLLMVTHDRFFLDRVCNEIWELDDNRLYRYEGDYQYFLEKKFERESAQKSETDKARNTFRRELEWVRKQPKARTTKSKSRLDAFEDVKERARAKGPVEKVQLDVKMNRIGGKVLELKKVYKAYGEKQLVKAFDYTFKRGERIGVIGPNGTGKSTFLDMIMGLAQPDSGKINVGETVQFGYYTQHGLKLKEDMRVIEYIKSFADMIELADGTKVRAESFAEQFLFSPQMQYTYVSKLSGGEKRRLMLLTVLIKNPNFLILDEPTNDLDLLTINTLEEFLENYGGCLLVVSHDRYFMDKLVDHLFVFEGNGVISDFPGNYSDYRKKREEKEATAAKESKQQRANTAAVNTAIALEQAAVKAAKPSVKLSYNEKREYDNLPKEIEKLESEKRKLEEAMTDPNLGHTKLMEHSKRIQEVIQELAMKEWRWLEIAEKVAQMKS